MMLAAMPPAWPHDDGPPVTDPADIRGLLFDKDGTVLDYWRTWLPINRAVASYAAAGSADLRDKALAAGGHDPLTDRVVAGSVFAGGTIDEIVAVLRDAVGAVAPADLPAMTVKLFNDGGAEHGVLVEGAREVLVQMKAERFDLGLATNDTAAGLEASLRKFRILPLFDFTCGCDSGFGGKPEPGMVHAFCRVTSLAPHEVAIIGDSVHDMEMAARAGAGLRIGVLSGTSGRDDLAACADVVLDSIADLPRFFRTPPGRHAKRLTRPWAT